MRRTLLLVMSISIVAACGSAKPTPGDSAAKGSGSAQPTASISVSDCEKLSQLRHERCGTDPAAAAEQCQIFLRLAEAGSCMAQANRSFECGLSSVRLCGDAACCAESIRSCDETDRAFDKCLRDHCAAHAATTDCKYAFPPAEQR